MGWIPAMDPSSSRGSGGVEKVSMGTVDTGSTGLPQCLESWHPIRDSTGFRHIGSGTGTGRSGG